jgi:hypothetical protein
MTQRHSKRFGGLAVAAALALAAVPAAQARHGADDPVGHDLGDDQGGQVVTQSGQGADDPANHDVRDDRRARNAHVRHRHRHRHHGRHHARHARHGADNGPRHDAGDDHGTR